MCGLIIELSRPEVTKLCNSEYTQSTKSMVEQLTPWELGHIITNLLLWVELAEIKLLREAECR